MPKRSKRPCIGRWESRSSRDRAVPGGTREPDGAARRDRRAAGMRTRGSVRERRTETVRSRMPCRLGPIHGKGEGGRGRTRWVAAASRRVLRPVGPPRTVRRLDPSRCSRRASPDSIEAGRPVPQQKAPRRSVAAGLGWGGYLPIVWPRRRRPTATPRPRKPRGCRPSAAGGPDPSTREAIVCIAGLDVPAGSPTPRGRDGWLEPVPRIHSRRGRDATRRLPRERTPSCGSPRRELEAAVHPSSLRVVYASRAGGVKA